MSKQDRSWIAGWACLAINASYITAPANAFNVVMGGLWLVFGLVALWRSQ